MKRLAVFVMLFTICVCGKSADMVYDKADSIKVVTLLREAEQLPATTNFMIYFAQRLTNIPYVAKTLEINKEEKLVINLRELDCTTYVETVTALTLCTINKKSQFGDFCHFLQQIRYHNAHIHYPDRLHYFTSWIKSNSEKGYVKEINSPNPPFTEVQTLNINFMSTHTQLYPMLGSHPEWIKDIRENEKQLTGQVFPFIPKQKIENDSIFRTTIHDGDIIAITTSKKGLDTSHIGIAIWHEDGIHLLNASQIHKKVIEEPMTLRTYMLKHPSQTGIRIIRLTPTPYK